MAIKKIKQQFGDQTNANFDKSPNSALVVTNYDDTNCLTIENLFADWKRLYVSTISYDEKIAR